MLSMMFEMSLLCIFSLSILQKYITSTLFTKIYHFHSFYKNISLPLFLQKYITSTLFIMLIIEITSWHKLGYKNNLKNPFFLPDNVVYSILSKHYISIPKLNFYFSCCMLLTMCLFQIMNKDVNVYSYGFA